MWANERHEADGSYAWATHRTQIHAKQANHGTCKKNNMQLCTQYMRYATFNSTRNLRCHGAIYDATCKMQHVTHTICDVRHAMENVLFKRRRLERIQWCSLHGEARYANLHHIKPRFSDHGDKRGTYGVAAASHSIMYRMVYITYRSLRIHGAACKSRWIIWSFRATSLSSLSDPEEKLGCSAAMSMSHSGNIPNQRACVSQFCPRFRV